MHLGRKTTPEKFLAAGWRPEEAAVATWSWAERQQAALLLPLPAGTTCYCMAEVAAISAEQTTRPQTIALSIDGTVLDTWTIDSTTVHDKLVTIPARLVTDASATVLTLSLQPTTAPRAGGLRLHSITLATELAAYLAELQTGYAWVCGLREQLIGTIRRVRYFLDCADGNYERAKLALDDILRNPFVQAGHQTPQRFDEHYLQANYPALKEGRVHQALRRWADDIQKLQATVVHIGNHATRRPGVRCWDLAGLTSMSPPHLAYNDKVAALREKNITLNNLELLLHRETISSVPPALYLDVTNRCNFRCRMCYQSSNDFLRQNLTNAHMAIILAMLPLLDHIAVGGLGEPLLSQNLLPLAERAGRLHCQTTIITNGSLIPANIHLLRLFSVVSISFDGAVAHTFETLRNRSNFEKIISNIQKLRHEAPELAIAFSVVLSRANLDELAAIVQWAATLGVRIVNVTPMAHMPLCELKDSDLPLFEAQLAEARHIADQNGITLSVAVSPQNFSRHDDTPCDKTAILDALASRQPLPAPDTPLEVIEQELRSLVFNYYPEPLVFNRSTWPAIENAAGIEPPRPDPEPEPLAIDQELARLDQGIAACLDEIRARSSSPPSLPYCLVPWKLTYIKCNGTNRLCCHADIVAGDMGSTGFKAATNTLDYQRIRQAMTGSAPLLPECRKCRAADRTLGLDSVYDTCRAYGIPLPEHKKPDAVDASDRRLTPKPSTENSPTKH